MPVIPATVGSIKRRIAVQADPGKKWDPISKMARVKKRWAGGVAQVLSMKP
jgi:hypothetical protein